MAATPDIPPDPTPLLDTEPTNTPDKFSYKTASFEEVLEDLSSRFILNLPEDELAEIERVCFQVEQAHWYYEDFIRDENPSFPSLPLKRFSEILFRSCPLLHHWSHDHETAFNGFMSYKTRVPVCGAIMLNESLTKCVLVKGWKSSAGWGFPKGKVNENEDEAYCAVREVLEETGYSLSGQIRRTDCIRLLIKQQPITLFVVAGVPEEFPFKTQTRKEISKIDWFKLADLPSWKKNRSGANKFYLITPVIEPLKAIVRNLRKTRKAGRIQQQVVQVAQTISIPEARDEAEVDEAGTTVTLESLVTVEHEPSPQSQSGEAEISSSQSSSIDPHTPSIHGDLAPHASDDTLVVKHRYSRDVEDIGDTDIGVPLEALSSSGLHTDPRTHWSRLMTRLNHSEESSPQGTPQASTPTPPIITSSTKPEGHLPDGSPFYQTQTTSGATLVEPSNADSALSDPAFSVRVSRRPPTIARSSSMSVPPHQASPPDVIVKRTRQLQLLDSVVAEESARRTPQPTSPMSAHILGAYPRPSGGLIPDHVRSPIRSASVNPEGPRNLFTPFHHKHSVSSLSYVLPFPAPTLSQHQFPSATQDHISQHQSSIFMHGRGSVPTFPGARPASILPSQLHIAPQAHLGSKMPASSLAVTPYGGNPAVDPAHRGQMLSILSGAGSIFRPSTAGSQDPVSSLSSRGSFSSTSTVTTSAPRSINAHLLSILNSASATNSGHGQEGASPVPPLGQGV